MVAVVWVSARSSIRIGGRNLMPKGALGNLFHIAAFSCIGWLVARALDKNGESAGLGTRTGKWAFLIATSFGISDEAHQFFTPGRVCSLSDAVLDALAAACALSIPWFGGAGRPRSAIPAAICFLLAVTIALATGYWRPPGDALLEASLSALGFQRP